MTINELFLKNGVKLEKRIALYVPSTTDATQAAPELAREMTERAAAALSSMFGGATITDANGAWITDAGELVRENVKIVYSYCSAGELDARAADVLALAEAIKREMTQEAVSVEIDGALYLI